MAGPFKSFADFYPYYLSEHENVNCRRLHFVGSLAGLACLVALVMTWNWWFLPLGLVAGYACAWIGHFVFEKNRPATFRHPLYSFVGDWVMFKDVLTGKVSLHGTTD